MNACCENPKQSADIARLEKEIRDNERDMYKQLLEQDSKIADMICKFGGNLEASIAAYLLYMEKSGMLDKIITETLLGDVAILESRTAGMVNVKEFGAAADGVWDDTAAIQAAIDYANEHGRRLYIPAGVYLISAPIVLNGCSLYGDPGNIYQTAGTVIKCLTADFTAIKQGSTSAADIMFNISDIMVSGAAVGFEIVYAINSKFERLYAANCATGFKIGDPAAVGCMFCEFNNLYTSNCEIGIDSHSYQYMNNNRFNNGFLQGNQYAMKLRVDGGYGAVGNVFNNVEFRSTAGRGIVLTSCINTVFNSCYFECGANAIRTTNFCTLTLNNGTYASFKAANDFDDKSVMFAEGGGAPTFNGGVVFLTEEYENIYFFDVTLKTIFQNIKVIKDIVKSGGAAGFDFFEFSLYDHAETVLTGTVHVPAGESVTVDFAYDKPFQSIPAVITATMRGEAGSERGLSFGFVERTAEGGKLSITNTSTGQRSVSFSIYAKSNP